MRECASTLELIERLLEIQGAVGQVKAQCQVAFGELGREGDRPVRIGERLVEVLANLGLRRVLGGVKRLDERSARECEGVVRVETDRLRIGGGRNQIVLASARVRGPVAWR